MDLLKDKLTNVSLYEVKAYVRKAQNGMFLSYFFSICHDPGRTGIVYITSSVFNTTN